MSRAVWYHVIFLPLYVALLWLCFGSVFGHLVDLSAVSFKASHRCWQSSWMARKQVLVVQESWVQIWVRNKGKDVRRDLRWMLNPNEVNFHLRTAFASAKCSEGQKHCEQEETEHESLRFCMLINYCMFNAFGFWCIFMLLGRTLGGCLGRTKTIALLGWGT